VLAELPRVTSKVTLSLVAIKGMHNPPHPGEVIRELCLEPLGLNVTDAARSLGVSR
jgi:hypothetical protein